MQRDESKRDEVDDDDDQSLYVSRDIKTKRVIVFHELSHQGTRCHNESSVCLHRDEKGNGSGRFPTSKFVQIFRSIKPHRRYKFRSLGERIYEAI